MREHDVWFGTTKAFFLWNYFQKNVVTLSIFMKLSVGYFSAKVRRL